MNIYLVVLTIFLMLIKNVTMLHWYRGHDINNQSFKFLVHDGFVPETHEMAKYVIAMHMEWSDHPVLRGSYHFCGGTIIKPDLILTAAHCVDNDGDIIDFKNVRVLAGTTNRFVTTETTELIEINEIVVYPHYKLHPTIKNDLALLKLKSKITIDGTTRAVMDIMDKPVAANTKCLVAGWGRLYDGPCPAEIVYANLKVLSAEDCKKKIFLNRYRKGIICTEGEGPTDACQGDSGGPLFCDGKVAGIVSYGDAACENRDAGAFTDVFYFRNWILANFTSRQDISRAIFVFPIIIILINLFFN